MAFIALLLVTQVPLGGALGVPLWAGICVLITVFILVYAAKAPVLSDIPACVSDTRRRRSRLDGQQAWRGHPGLAREPLRCRRDLPDHRRGARIHFPEDRLGAGQGHSWSERRRAGSSSSSRAEAGSASRRLSANRGLCPARPSGKAPFFAAKRISRDSGLRRLFGAGRARRILAVDGFEARGARGQSASLATWRDRAASRAAELDRLPAATKHEFLALPCTAEPLLSRRAAPPGNALDAVGRGNGRRRSHSAGRDGGRSRANDCPGRRSPRA